MRTQPVRGQQGGGAGWVAAASPNGNAVNSVTPMSANRRKVCQHLFLVTNDADVAGALRAVESGLPAAR